MNQPETIECKDAFLTYRTELWQHSASLAVLIQKRFSVAFPEWSMPELHSVALQVTYDVMVGQISDGSSDRLLDISQKYRTRKPEMFRYPCIAQWSAERFMEAQGDDDCDAVWRQVKTCRSHALNTLSDLLSRHLPTIRSMMEREVAGSLKAGATANDVTSIAFEKIQQRLLDGRMELMTHPEFRSFCRNCARDVIRKMSRRVMTDDDERFRRRQAIETKPNDNESTDDRNSMPLPDRALSLDGDFGGILDALSKSRTPSEYMSTQDLKAWVNRMCNELDPMESHLLRRRTMDGLSFVELEKDPVFNPDGTRTSEAIRKQFNRLLDQLRERFGSQKDGIK